MNENIPAATIPVEIPKSNLNGLTPKQEKFVEAYIRLNDATKACIMAGYSPRSANVEACRMLKRDNVIQALKDWRKSKREQLTKDSFVDKAMNCFEELDVKEPNKPRFLDLAGKALNYTSNQTVNNTNILIAGDELSAIRELLTKRGKQLIIPSETKPLLAIPAPVSAVPEPENTAKTQNVNNT